MGLLVEAGIHVFNSIAFSNIMGQPRDYIVKAFSVIQLHIFKWNEVIVRCQSLLKELSSQIEQLECLKKSKPCSLAKSFPDLKDRLLQIIQMTIDEKLDALHSAWEELSLAIQKLKSTCDVTQKAYLDNNSSWEANPYFFHGSPLHPPISLALEQMEEVNIYYSNQLSIFLYNLKRYLQAHRLLVVKYSLEMFDYSSESFSLFSEVFNSKHPPLWIENLMLQMTYYLDCEK